jgi:hypothetical protein
MAKKRLNNGNRRDLRTLAWRMIRETTDTSEVDAAYAEAAKVISEEVSRRYPAEDMAVLAKYEMSHPDTCVYVSRGGQDYDVFHFRDDDPLTPVRPGSRYDCNRRNPILLQQSAVEALDRFKSANAKSDKDAQRRQADFYALINDAKTFEDVVAVWPAAERLRSLICGTGTAITTLSAEVMDRIKSDAAFNVSEPTE